MRVEEIGEYEYEYKTGYVAAFYDENFNLINSATIPGVATIFYLDNQIYGVTSYNNELGLSVSSIIKFDDKGNIVASSDAMRCGSLKSLSVSDGTLIMTTQTYTQSYGAPDSYEGKLFLINKETLADIDTIKMAYDNAALFAVFPAKDYGYSVFLTRKDDYKHVDNFKDENLHNVYIYHVKDLHNLQVE